MTRLGLASIVALVAAVAVSAGGRAQAEAADAATPVHGDFAGRSPSAATASCTAL